MLNYFLWYHGIALGVSILLAAIALSDYANNNGYDGGEIDKGHVWVRHGGGVVRAATKAEVYSHYNPGKSYRKEYQNASKAAAVIVAVLWIGLALVLPPLLIRRAQWAEAYSYFNHPLWIFPTLAVAALAALTACRAAFGFSRWRRLQKRHFLSYSKRSGVTMTAEETSGWGLSEADNVVSWIVAALLCAIGLFHFIILHDARKDPAQEFHGTMILLAVQGGLTVLYGVWVLIEHLLRKRACR